VSRPVAWQEINRPAFRRLLLRGLCAGTVLTVANGWIGVERAVAASTSDPWGAWQALRDAVAYPDPRVRAIAYGVLAPNVQNLQPWLIRLVGDDALLVFAGPPAGQRPPGPAAHGVFRHLYRTAAGWGECEWVSPGNHPLPGRRAGSRS
jgi:hypothetical protein